jgi:hypothetical protein
MCITSIECKIVMTVMLTIMSGMDSHMISRDTSWYGNGLDEIELIQLKYRPVGAGCSLSCCPVGAGGSPSK